MMNKMMTMHQKAGHRVGLYGKPIETKSIRVIKTRESDAERRARWKREDRECIRNLERVGLTASNSKAVATLRRNYFRKYGESA